MLDAKYILIKLCDEKTDELKEISKTAAPVITSVKTSTYWERLSNLAKLIEHPVYSIGKLEGDKAELSLVFHYFDCLLEHFKDDRVVCPKVQQRWKFLMQDVHRIAYILTPRFAADGHYTEDKLGIMGKMREFSDSRFPENSNEVSPQLVRFVREIGQLPQQQKDLVYEISSLDYWETIGKEKYPALYPVAKIVCAMPCSSAAAERVWSIFGFVHKPLRNRLANDKVDKLVFLYVNAGLLDEKDKCDYILDYISTFTETEFDE